MLDTDPVDGSFLSIIICEDPAGINAISDLNLNIQNHSQQNTIQVNHSQHHGGHQNHTDHDDHATQDHAMSSCSFWSSSSHSLLVNLSFFDMPTSLLLEEVIFYQYFNTHRLFSNTRFARAPPTLS